MGQGTAGRDVPVVILRRELPGLNIRMLVDRDVGQIIWEVEYLNDDRSVESTVERRLRPVELLHMDEIVIMIDSALREFNPRRRLDLTRLHPPVPSTTGDQPIESEE